MDSNPESCNSKQARYQLSHPSHQLATYLPGQLLQFYPQNVDSVLPAAFKGRASQDFRSQILFREPVIPRPKITAAHSLIFTSAVAYAGESVDMAV